MNNLNSDSWSNFKFLQLKCTAGINDTADGNLTSGVVVTGRIFATSANDGAGKMPPV
jgi:hypothetical protein